ncbi:MAG: hypothetical protein DRN06_03280 [Thermoprotei archaeon]|nr:MAG: hypothetical protein DRN06_03280 [Thermoprotei archaeon]
MKCNGRCTALFKRHGHKLVIKCPLNCLGADLADNPLCRAKTIYWLSRAKVNELVIKTSFLTKLYEGRTVKLLSDYARRLVKARAEVLDTKLLTSCQGALACFEAKKGFLVDLFSLHPSPGLLYTDPLTALLRVDEELKKLSMSPAQGKGCKECVDEYTAALKKLRGRLRSSDLIKEGLKLVPRSPSTTLVYTALLKPSRTLISPYSREKAPSSMAVRGILLDEYLVPPFKIKIFHLNTLESLYVVSLALNPWERLVVNEVVKRLNMSSTYIHGLGKNRLSFLIDVRRRDVENVLEALWFEGFEQTKNSRAVTEASVFKSLGLLKLAPFLLDEMVEEFFLDKPSSHIYLIHSKWGRCRSNVILNERDVNRIITHLKIDSGLPLDYENPSLKCELITEAFHVRASVDIPPLAVDGPTLDFRKLRKKVWTLPDLVNNGTLTPEAAAYLLFCLFRRRNITVVGEPNTGKTTLINALDLCSPPHWRKIYVEDVTESIPQLKLGKHQVRLKVSPFESRRQTFLKSLEVLRLLHRSPDFVILSEIQTPEHSKALFQALSSGLRGLQTCHASTLEGLLRRWILHHGISPINLLDLDLLVQMKTVLIDGREVRRMVRLSEVKVSEEVSEVSEALAPVKLVDVFTWIPNLGLVRQVDLYETPTLSKIKELEFLSRKRFEEEIRAYQELLLRLSSSSIDPATCSTKLSQLYFRYVAGLEEASTIVEDI